MDVNIALVFFRVLDMKKLIFIKKRSNGGGEIRTQDQQLHSLFDDAIC